MLYGRQRGWQRGRQPLQCLLSRRAWRRHLAAEFGRQRLQCLWTMNASHHPRRGGARLMMFRAARTRFSVARDKARKPNLLSRRPCPPQFASRHRVQIEPRTRGSAASSSQQPAALKAKAARAENPQHPLLPLAPTTTSKAAARAPVSMSTLVSASCVSAAGDEGFVVEESFVAPAGSIGVQGALPQREQAGREAAHRAFVAAGRDGLRGRARPAMPRTPEQAAKLWQE